MAARQVLTYTCVVIFGVTIVFLFKVALSLYLYKAIRNDSGPPGRPGPPGPPGLPGPSGISVVNGEFGLPGDHGVRNHHHNPPPSGPPGFPGPRWKLSQYGSDRYPGFSNRNLDCELYAVGKPVFHGYFNMTYGSWMIDSLPASNLEGEKLWVTNENELNKLYEYDHEKVVRKSDVTRIYKLYVPFQGNGHVIYNGSFYYQALGKPKLIRYFLNNETNMELAVPKINVTNGNYLYTTENNYMDFSVDDNGLWVIFPVPDANNTAVMKVDVSTMQVQYIWNISIDHHLVGEMFVVCGVLYAIDNVTDRNTRIRFALDLYNNRLLDVNLSFWNPFRKTTMVGYNHRNKELYSLDKGNLLTYPIEYNEMGNFTNQG